MAEKTLRDRRIRGLPIDKPKTFLEKYPEFKDLISYDEECETEFVAVGLIESVLDKLFKRRRLVEFSTFSLEGEDYKEVKKHMLKEYKQEVKDAIFKNFEGCSWNVHYDRVKPLLKDLGFEDNGRRTKIQEVSKD